MNEVPYVTGGPQGSMSSYEQKVWDSLNEHWDTKSKRRGMPDWATGALGKASDAAGAAAKKVGDATPERIKEPLQKAGESISMAALKPAVGAAASLLDLVNEWCLELNDPKFVETAASKRGVQIESFADLREQDLKFCDRLLARHTLAWASIGAVEGGAMGALALVPVAGIPVAITADVLVVQALSVSIAARISYSYGFDAKDPEEAEFIRRMVQRTFVAQAAKTVPLNETANAAAAIAGRQNWSAKLRADHRLIAALEKLMNQLGPAGTKVPVMSVAKALPFIGIILGAGMNSQVLRSVAADAQRYCQTRFLSEKYGLETPASLRVSVLAEDELADIDDVEGA